MKVQRNAENTYRNHHILWIRAPDKRRILFAITPISSQNPMFDRLLESSHCDDSYKWSIIRFGKEIKTSRVYRSLFSILSGVLMDWWFDCMVKKVCFLKAKSVDNLFFKATSQSSLLLNRNKTFDDPFFYVLTFFNVILKYL